MIHVDLAFVINKALLYIVAVISAPGLVKTHEGSHADLKWGFNVNPWDGRNHIHDCTIYTNYSVRILRFYHHPTPEEARWYGDYEDRGEILMDERELQIGIRLNNISKADAHQYMLTYEFESGRNSDAVIYVYGRH